MNDPKWQRLRDLFDAVQEMPETERKRFLDRELPGDDELREELDSLLMYDATAGHFLEAPDPNPTSDTTSGAPLRSGGGAAVGSSVGPYRLDSVLGEGGFGVVYLAEQSQPIRRRVALKLIKPGMDTKQVIARFGAERQALALMDHPGIAQVFEAGETEDGRPYFAMEYVPGTTITAFCDGEHLRIRERLELFLQACDAVRHAHQKGIVHRDIKPSNVMVARRDGLPAIKIIDFGIGKATSGDDDRGFQTREGVVLGTIGYMSPEQTGAIDAPIDTRSDIYSLGALFYELLTGELPFGRMRLRKAAGTEAARILREEDPPSLTARLARTDGGTAYPGTNVTEIARRRSVDERTLRRELRGELEWIARKALERDPEHRYASASELAADVRRHLANEPVLAGAPTTMYRIRKFARRHRVGVATATLLLLSIVAGGIAAAVGFGRAVRSERVAQREAESARQVADFLVNLFDASTPDRSFGETITARTLLDLGARRIDGDTIDDPLVRARLLSTLASAHGKLGLFEEALELEQNAVEATRSAVPEEGPELARELIRLAEIQRSAGKSAEVDSVIDRSIEILSRTSEGGSVDLASALHQKSGSLRDRGEFAAADSTIRVAIRMVESQAHPDTSVLASFYNTKAGIATQRGNMEEEERDFEHALSLAIAAHGERHSQVLVIHRNLASLYAKLERFEEATRHSDEALRLARVMFPAEHPYVAAATQGRGDILRFEQKWAEAAELYEEAIAILRKSYAGDHLMLASLLYTLGSIYESGERLDLAIERMSECVAMRSRIHGPENPRTAESQTSLARFYQQDGANGAADSIYRAALPNLEQAVKSRPHAVAYAYMGYANLCRDAGRLTEADTLYTRASALMDTTNAILLGYYAECIADQGYLRSLQGRHAEAESTMQDALEIYRRVDGENAGELANPYFLWAVARARKGDADGAIDLLERALERGYPPAGAAASPELAALRARPDFPAELRALSAK